MELSAVAAGALGGKDHAFPVRTGVRLVVAAGFVCELPNVAAVCRHQVDVVVAVTFGIEDEARIVTAAGEGERDGDDKRRESEKAARMLSGPPAWVVRIR
jgi:hypothetical protein